MSAFFQGKIYTLPLFPLHTILFPQFPIQLHVFEERYKAMITNCITQAKPFGIVLIREGDEVGSPAVPHEVGCAARIMAVRRFEDGRMNLLAIGEDRFRLLDYHAADLPYLLGKVEIIEDFPHLPNSFPRLVSELQERFRQYLALLSAHIQQTLPDFELPDDPTSLSFCVASVAMIPLPEKQRLLEMTEPADRLLAEMHWLNVQIEELETLRAQPTPTEDKEKHTLIARTLDINAELWQHYRRADRN